MKWPDWRCIAALFLFASATEFRLGAQQPSPAPVPSSPPPSQSGQSPDVSGPPRLEEILAKAKYHFLLYADGGAIEIEAGNPAQAARESVCLRLREASTRFGAGDFPQPLFARPPGAPGIEAMHRLTSEITYTAEVTPRGAQVRMTSNNVEARAAIHQFMRFEIDDRHTGDPLDVSPVAAPRRQHPGNNLGRDAPPAPR